jgi:DNA-binding SARP family transcriptional activator
MPHLMVSLFGSYRAVLDGSPLNAFETNKTRALLAFLMVESDRPHRREALAALFWSDWPESAARNNLRQTLYRLRQVIADQGASPPHLLVTSNEIQFDTASDYWLDVATFGALLAASQRHHPNNPALCEECVGRLRTAIGLYQGDFLSGFSLSNCPQFDWWTLRKQEEYHRKAIDALARVGKFYASRRNYSQAGEFAQKEIDLEPWREAAHRRLMRALALSGQRTVALRQYQVCREILSTELGIEPSPETRRLYEQIRNGKILKIREKRIDRRIVYSASEGSASSILTAAYPAAMPARLVGRGSELARLYHHLGAMLNSQGRVVLITGEAGSGKTMLVAEFIRQAMQAYDNLLSTWGSSSAHSGAGDPYLPFREALRMLFGDLEAGLNRGLITEAHAMRVRTALPEVVQALVENGPDLLGTLLARETLEKMSQELGGIEPTWQPLLENRAARSAQTPGTEQMAVFSALNHLQQIALASNPSAPDQAAIFDQMTQVLQALARRRPLVLVLDDLQWVDPDSANLLFHLGRRLAGSRILIAGAYRPEDVTRVTTQARHPLDAIINELQSLYGEIRVDLDEADGRRFVEALLDSESNHLDQAFRQTLYRHTRGHPLFTVELLRGLQERGDLLQDEAGYWIAGPNLDWERLPPRAEAVIAERLQRLPRDWRKLLAAASVQGETFIAEVLAEATGVNEAEVVECLSGPLSKQHRLVEARGRESSGDKSLSIYQFRHNLYQKYLYQSLDVVERGRLEEATHAILEAPRTPDSQ